ncbi:MAG: hypothetical protein FK733_13530 [Asgard group archaeon]|nr:hypothetical protein [Asgard group archaeon]
MIDTVYQEIDEQEEAEMPIIHQTSDYYVEDKLVYHYNKETGLLKLDIDKKGYTELLKNLGDFPNEGASFCFLLPQMGEVCFTGVKKIDRLNQDRGFVRRISRIFRRRNR